MYLTGDVAAETFRMIREFAGKKSRIVCDFIYQSVLRKENLFYGGQDIYTRVNKYGEAWKFGIEKTEIENYFQNQGFSVSEVADEDFLRKKYFNNDDSYRINGTHCIVRLEVK